MIEGLTIARGLIRASHAGLGRFQATIRGNAIVAASSFAITIDVVLERANAANEALVRGNVIEQIGSGQSGAIRIGSRQSTLTST